MSSQRQPTGTALLVWQLFSVFHKFGVAQVFWGTIHSDIIYGNDYKEVTRVIPTSLESNELAAEWAVKQVRYQKMGFIVNDTTDYGTKKPRRVPIPHSKNAAVKYSNPSVLPLDSRTLQAVLSKVKALEPEGIYYGGVVNRKVLAFLLQAKKSRSDRCYVHGPLLESNLIHTVRSQAQTVKGAFCSGTFDVNSTPEGIAFVEAYDAVL